MRHHDNKKPHGVIPGGFCDKDSRDGESDLHQIRFLGDG